MLTDQFVEAKCLFVNEKRLSDREKWMSDGEKRLSDGEKWMSDDEKRLSDGEKWMSDGEKRMSDGEKRMSDDEKRLSVLTTPDSLSTRQYNFYDQTGSMCMRVMANDMCNEVNSDKANCLPFGEHNAIIIQNQIRVNLMRRSGLNPEFYDF